MFLTAQQGLVMDGILNINKPWGKTSFSLVAKVRRLSGERRVGHAGTLDPAASGVLPVGFGRGTRVIEFLLDATKVYRAEVELGAATDTYDADGQLVQRGDPSGVSREQLEAKLALFRGSIQQVPPMYSAVKCQGKPLYELARVGITVERKSRLVQIHRLELVDWQPPVVTVEVVCGKGTYIRSLAHDLGQALGCGAYLKNLIRSRYGLFDVRDAISELQLEDAFRYGYWQDFVYPIDSVLSHWAAVVVSDDVGRKIRNGRPLELGDVGEGEGRVYLKQYLPDWSSSESRCRVYALDGHFLGVLRFDAEKRQWQPEKVFH